MLSFTDVLHDLVRRGVTLRFDPEGQLFIYDPQHRARAGAAKAESAAAAGEAQTAKRAAGAKGGAKSAQKRAAGRDAGMPAGGPRPLIPDSGMQAPALPPPPPPGPEWRGITWKDVPGHDESSKRLNFALLKRGMLRGHKCCRPLEGEVLKQRLQDLSQRNRGNSQACRGQAWRRHQPTPRPKPP